MIDSDFNSAVTPISNLTCNDNCSTRPNMLEDFVWMHVCLAWFKGTRMPMPTHKSNSRGRLHSSTDADLCDLDVLSQEVQTLSWTNNLGNLFILGTLGFICGHLHHTTEVSRGRLPWYFTYKSDLLTKNTHYYLYHSHVASWGPPCNNVTLPPHEAHHGTLYLGLTCDVLILLCTSAPTLMLKQHILI